MINGKRAVILCHGELWLDDFKLRTDDVLICADGGAEYAARMGWRPHVIIGDLDSIPAAIRNKWAEAGVAFEIYPVEKDKTDGELALDYAVRLGVSEVLILGALGGRVDHLLTNVLMLTKYIPAAESGGSVPSVRILGTRQAVWLTGRYTTIRGKVGDIVSLIPLSEQVTGVSTKGLYYPLTNGVLKFGSSLGNSNRLVSDVATVEVGEGNLLVVHTWGE